MLRYNRINSGFFTDTLLALKGPSKRGNRYAQLFVSDKGFVAVYPMQKQSDFQQALHRFCEEIGVLEKLLMEAHPAQTSSATRRLGNQVRTIMKVLEQGTPWANIA